MQGSMFSWIVEHKEWSFATLCTVSAGVFAFIKWAAPRNSQKAAKSEGGIDVQDSHNSLSVITAGGSINAPMIVGSNNFQSVTIAPPPAKVPIPIRQRKATSPTGNDIRQKEASALQDIPLFLQTETRKRLLNSYLNIDVGWPIRLYGVSQLGEYVGRPALFDDELLVNARFGEESWGACIRFIVRASDFPILRTVSEAHHAFVEGRIKRVEGMDIVLEISSLEVE
jgi:hypothetical protein